MDRFIPLKEAERALTDNSWQLIETDERRIVVQKADGPDRTIRRRTSHPEQVHLDDLLECLPDLMIQAAEGSEVYHCATGGTGTATLDPDVAPAGRVRGTGSRLGGPPEAALRIVIEPGDASEEDIREYLEALSELNRAMGGEGIDFDEIGVSGGGRA